MTSATTLTNERVNRPTETDITNFTGSPPLSQPCSECWSI